MKRRIFSAVMTVMLLSACAEVKGTAGTQQREIPLANASPLPEADMDTDTKKGEDTIKAVWISYIDLADIITGSENSFRTGFERMCKNCRDQGLNTLFVHVRAFGDAYYRSELFPPSDLIPKNDNGDILFDPLEIMTETAHSYGLALHAWINPMRLQSRESMESVSSTFRTRQWLDDGSGRVNEVDGDMHLWLDPTHKEVRELIAEGAAEICRNYDVDGIHYDDYFYPTTDAAFDAECFTVQNEYDDLAQYRLDCVSQMCADIYSTVKSESDSITVSISPQGNIENNYNSLYADVKRWLTEDGYADIIVPQIYYGYDNLIKPYKQTLEEWRSLDADKPIVVGLAAYKIGSEDEFTDTVGIIALQARDAVEGGCQGYAVYNYISLFDGGERMAEERKAMSDLGGES